MDSNELFWATGINNGGLTNDVNQAIGIFKTLSASVKKELLDITNAYKDVIGKTKLKFDNPVDSGMISSIISQINSLGKVIDVEITKLGQFSASYDNSINRISKAAGKIKNAPTGSPLAKTVSNIKQSVKSADREITFLEQRFRYAIGSMVAYGSVNVFKNLVSDIITVKGQFDQLDVAIKSFIGDADKADKVFNDLTTFATKSPFQLLDITDAAKQLLAYGENADTVTSTIQKLSDVSSGAKQPLKDIAYLYGTSLTQGRLYARDLFQFANRGVPIYKALAATMTDFNGTVGITTEQVMKMVSAGQVGFNQLKTAIDSMTAAGGIYYGLSDKLAETTYGKISNLRDKWTLALQEMGESTEGIVNDSVEGITKLIENWEDLARVIGVSVTAVGSYQVAKLMVGVQNQATATVANEAESKALEKVIIAQNEANAAKTQGSYAASKYTLALRAEAAQLLATAETAVASAQSEVTVQTEKLAVIESNLALSKANLAQKLKGAVATNTQTAAEQVNIAAKEVSTLQTEKNTAAKELNTAQATLNAAAAKKEAIAKGIDSAANAADTATTDFLAVAKNRLIMVTKSLYATMLANPYATAFVAVSTLVAVMWALHDSTTASEQAQKELNDVLSEVTEKTEAQRKKYSDLLNVILKETSARGEQIKALNKMKELYPDIFASMTLEDVKRQGAIKLQKQYNEELFKSEKAEKLWQLTRAAANVQQAKSQYESGYVPTTMMSGAGASAQTAINNRLTKARDAAQQVYDGLKKDYEEYLKANRDLNNDPDVTPVIMNKAYWQKAKKEAEDAINGIESDYISLLKKASSSDISSFTVAGVPGDITKAYSEAIAKKKKATDALAAYDDSQLKKAQETANKEKLAAEKRIAAIASNNQKLANIATQAEIEYSQAKIDAMDDGFAKQQAQQKLNFEKQLANIKKQRDQMLKLEQENATNEFINKNPNYKKEGKSIPVIDTLNDKDQETYNKLVAAANEANDAAIDNLLKDKLKEYEDYNTQKLEIDKKYNEDVLALEEERKKAEEDGNDELVSSINSAIRQAKTDQAKEQMSLSFDQLKKSPDFKYAFSDLDSVSTTTLKSLIDELGGFKDEAASSFDVKNLKEYMSTWSDLVDEMIERNPGEALSMFKVQLDAAQQNLATARSNLSTVQSGGKIQTGISYDESTNKMSIKYLSEAEALQKVQEAQQKVIESTSDYEKAEKSLSEQVEDLMTSLSSVGDSIGGTAGDIIGLISDIGTFVTTTSTSIESITSATAESMGALEKASVILTIISTAIQLYEKVMDLIPSAYDEYEEYAEKIDEINTLTDAVNEYKLAVLEATQAEDSWFGTDSLGDLKDYAEQAALVYEEYYDKLYEMQATYQNETGGNSVLSWIVNPFLSLAEALSDSSYSDTLTAAIDNLVIETQEAKKGFLGIGSQDQETENLVDWVSENLGVDLFDEDGWLNEEAYQTLMDNYSDKLQGETEATLEQLYELQQQYEEYQKELGEYVDDLYSPLVEDMTDALWDWLDSGEDALDSFKDYAADTFKDIMNDMLETIILDQIFGDYKDEISALYSSYASGNLDEEALLAEVAALTAELADNYEDQLPTLESLLEEMSDTLEDATGIDISDTSSSSNSTSSAIQSMTESQADVLTAQFTALRVHGANIDTYTGYIYQDTTNILLSLQSQAQTLQTFLNDISDINTNTARLETIESIMSDIQTNGVLMK